MRKIWGKGSYPCHRPLEALSATLLPRYHLISDKVTTPPLLRSLTYSNPTRADAAALASSPPPSYEASSSLPTLATIDSSNGRSFDALHPRVAVLLGVKPKWHIPLLICRALSTAPAGWWGLRCALTFLGELLRSDGNGIGRQKHAWSVEQRFRVTEVFLAILWVILSGTLDYSCVEADEWAVYSVLQLRIFRSSSQIVSCRDGTR